MNAKLLVRHLKKNKQAATTIFICSMIGAFLVASLFINSFSMEKSFDINYMQLSAPCYQLSSEDEQSIDEFGEYLSKDSQFHEYVSDVEEYDRLIAKGVEISGNEYPFTYVAVKDAVSNEDNKVYINNTIDNIKCGDVVKFKEISETYSVENIVVDPVNSAPNVMNTVLYVNKELYEKLKPYCIKNERVIDIYSTDYKYFKNIDEIMQTHPGRTFVGNIKTYESIKSDYLLRYRLIGRYLVPVAAIILIFLMILVILLVDVIMTSDKEVIEVYRFVGMSVRKILYVYTLGFAGIITLGSTIGAIFGLYVIKIWLSGMFVHISNMRFELYHVFLWVIASVSVITVFLLITIIIMCFHKVRTWMSDGKLISSTTRHGIVARRSYEHTGPFSKFLNKFQNIIPIAVKLGYIFGIRQKGIAVCSAIVTFFMGSLMLFTVILCAGVLDRNNHLDEWGIADMDIYVSRINNVDEKQSGLLDYLDNNDLVDYYYAALSDVVGYRTDVKTGNIVAEIYNETIPDNMDKSFITGTNPHKENEIAVGMNFARDNSLLIGDVIDILHGDDIQKMTVTGIYSSYKEYSDSVRYVVSDIISYFDNNADGYYSIVLKNKSDIPALKNELEKMFSDYSFITIKRGINDIIHGIIVPLLVIMFLSVIIYVLILRVLLKMLLIYRQNDIITLAYIGAAQKNICIVIRTSMVWAVVSAVVLAVPYAFMGMPWLLCDAVEEIGLQTVSIYPCMPAILVGIFLIILSVAIALRKRNIIRKIHEVYN